jgi:hypothetical protein
MQEVHLWMWRCFGSSWSGEAEEISSSKRIKHRPKTFSLFESIRQSSFKNVTPISHKNSNLFFFAKEAVCTLYHLKLP